MKFLIYWQSALVFVLPVMLADSAENTLGSLSIKLLSSDLS
jgi:hypothetical protein